MIDRYFITLGAPTSAGGKVTSANHTKIVGDAPVALEGDSCWCPACGSDGVIGLDGPRLSDLVDGREIALGDDLCLCGCSPPPRLVANQALVCQSVDSDWYAGQAAAAAETAAASNAAAPLASAVDCLPLQLIDPDTDEPFRNRPYHLELPDGPIEGVLDHNGHTRPLSGAERAGVHAWQVDGSAT